MFLGEFFQMGNFKFGSNHKESGKIVYNAGIIDGIVALAINEVEGASVAPSKKHSISLYIEKDGVYADVSVIVQYGYNVPELAYRIQQSIKHNVENMTSYKVAKVNVHILDVVFDETAKPDEATEQKQEEEES
jgi:uncharacterized alkaline shock family protein YloU